jgi:drug/metabolite transporter (DMT)-like permease
MRSRSARRHRSLQCRFVVSKTSCCSRPRSHGGITSRANVRLVWTRNGSMPRTTRKGEFCGLESPITRRCPQRPKVVTSGMSQAKYSHLWPGVPMALASAVLFGVATPFSKILLGTVNPQLLAGMLYLGAGLGLACVHFSRAAMGIPAPEAPLRTSDIPWLAAVVLFGGLIAPLLLMLGLVHTEAATGSLLLNVEGLATMGIAWVVFRENVDRQLLLGALAIIAGAVVLSWQSRGLAIDTGAALIVGACLAWGIDNNLTRKLSSADPVMIVMIKGLAAGTANTCMALLSGADMPLAGTICAAAVVGFLSVGVSLVLFVLALRHLGTARTGAYFSLAPFIGAMVAILLLHELLTLKLVVSGLLMGFGLWMHLAERHSHEHQHEALEHEHSHEHDEHHRHTHDEPTIEPHSHWHRHAPLRHAHPHYPDLHHRHRHG